MRRPVLTAFVLMPLAWSLAGCDLLGIETASAVAAKRDAEGRAIGGACRHAGRAIEDCYALNRRADKAAVFAGWREMNDYMRENAMASVPPGGELAEVAADAPADKPGAEGARPAAGDTAGAAAKGKPERADKPEGGAKADKAAAGPGAGRGPST